MASAWEVYDLLLDNAISNSIIEEVLIGLTWTLCRTSDSTGLAMSCGVQTRTLPWSGELTEKTLKQLSEWIRHWDEHESTVGMAAINATINKLDNKLLQAAIPVNSTSGKENLAVFDHFAEQIAGQRVVVVGRYPGLDEYKDRFDLTVLERVIDPATTDLPDSACEYVLPDADWVFLTATSLINKTFPRLAELALNAKLVLMGPTVPWLSELASFGVNYLAGVNVVNPDILRQTVAEGGGKRIFEKGVRYYISELATPE